MVKDKEKTIEVTITTHLFSIKYGKYRLIKRWIRNTMYYSANGKPRHNWMVTLHPNTSWASDKWYKTEEQAILAAINRIDRGLI